VRGLFALDRTGTRRRPAVAVRHVHRLPRDALRGRADRGRSIEMGKLVVTEFVSVDGVFEDPGGSEGFEHGGWTFEYDRGDEGNAFKLDEITEAEGQVLGGVTEEGFAAAWPSRDGPFADKLNADPKVVVSTTLTDPEWQNTTVVSTDVA